MPPTRQEQYDQQALESLKGRFPRGSTVDGSVVHLPVPAGTPLGKLAVGSIRVSKGRDTMISPEIQWDSIVSFSASRDLVLSKVFLDMHKSGRKFEKRAVLQIVEDIKHKEYTKVVLWKWSRWGRNAGYSSMYVNEVESSGGKVYAATEDIDTSTAIGKFHRGFMFQLAEFDSDQKGEQWREAQAQRRKNGLPHTSCPRFGYDYSNEAYTVVPEEAELLRDAYEKFVSGASMYSLSMYWNGRGLRTRQDKAWNPTSLGRMMDTGFAAGLIRERSIPGTADSNSRTLASFNRWREGKHDPIISRELWEQYKDKRLVNAQTAPRLIRATHPLTGLMMCRECGRTMVSVYSGRHKKHTWSCRKVMTERAHAPVTLSNMRAEATVLAWVMDRVKNSGDVEKMARAHRDEATQEVADINAMKRKIARLIAKRDKLVSEWTDDAVSDEDYSERRANLDRVLERENLALAQAKQATAPAQDPGPLYQGVLDLWGVATPEQKNELLRSVVRCFLIGTERFVGPVDFDKVTPISLWHWEV